MQFSTSSQDVGMARALREIKAQSSVEYQRKKGGSSPQKSSKKKGRSNNSSSPRRALAAALHRDGTLNQHQPLAEFTSDDYNHTNSGVGRLAYRVSLAFDWGHLPPHIKLLEDGSVARYRWRPPKYVGQYAGGGVGGSDETNVNLSEGMSSAGFKSTVLKWGGKTAGGNTAETTALKKSALNRRAAPKNYEERVCTVVASQLWEASEMTAWVGGELHGRILPVVHSVTFRIEAIAGVMLEEDEEHNADYESDDAYEEENEANDEQEEARVSQQSKTKQNIQKHSTVCL